MHLLAATWEKLAQWNPTYAILTHPQARESGWNLEEFFATGEQEIAACMAHVARLAGRRHFRRALDFGCGLGRLTRPLAGYADRVVGIDISPTMVRRATELGPPPQVTFLHSDQADLRRFAEASFDLICSRLVLQHMTPRHAKCYLAELMRVLAPGGVLFFQLPAPPRGARTAFKHWWHRTYQRIIVLLWVLGGRPQMEMHGIATKKVQSLLSSAGAAAVDVQREGSDGHLDSFAYTVVKRPMTADPRFGAARSPYPSSPSGS